MDVVIVGAGGHGRVVLDILRCAKQYNPIGFIDAAPALAGTRVGGLPVFGPINQLPKLKQQKTLAAIIAIGDNRARQACADKVTQAGLELINAIHPSAVVSAGATLGRNIVIAAGSVICTEAKLADGVIVNTGAIVEHECTIGPAAHICPGAKLAGRVSVAAGALIGLGACIVPCISIGEAAIVGAGAVVIHDVPAHATVVGVPARVIKVATVVTAS
jgi:sugar O-acyltransferase (sialic acid O-acetyltransferase NeuD family)